VRLYELTDWGRELEPVVLHLGRWGNRAPLPQGAQASLDSVLLAIKAAVGPARVAGRYELRIGDDTFTVDATAGRAHFRRGTADQPDATVTADADTFRAVAFGQCSITDAIESGELRLDGDSEATSRLAGLLLTLTLSPSPTAAGSPQAAGVSR
jgi:hypothetical protein